MTPQIFILGAGISGIMAKYMLQDKAMVLEGNPGGSRTFKMGANYLWEDVDIFETKKVKVVTTVDGNPATSESIARYKNKIGKSLEDSENWGEQFKEEMDGYLIEKVPEVEVAYNTRVTEIDLDSKILYIQNQNKEIEKVKYRYLLSTIPFPILLKISRLVNPELIEKWFKSKPIHIWHTEFEKSKERVVTVDYISSPSAPVYRITRYLCEGFEHAECLEKIHQTTSIVYPGKIWESNKTEELMKHLNVRGVYCFGRYASWSPEELVHITYNKLLKFKQEWINEYK